MYIALIIVHVILCILLIVTILLQAGRGGGLTEMFGGDTAQSVLGTQAPALLKKVTEVSAIGFIITSLVLGMVTARRGQSLFEGPIMPQLPVEQGTMALPYTTAQEGENNMDAGELPPAQPIAFPGESLEIPGEVAPEAVNVESAAELAGDKVEETAATAEKVADTPITQN